MALSGPLAKRRDYPFLNQKTREKLTDTFYFKYIDPNDNRIKTKSLKYLQQLSRPLAQDVFNLESEIGTKPNTVLRMLYYKRDEARQEWVETEAKIQDPFLSEDITKIYYDEIRPGAYPKGYEDFYGAEQPAALDPRDIYVQQLETLVSLASNNLEVSKQGMDKRIHNTNPKVIPNSSQMQNPQTVNFSATGQ
jgi:hypothetical protein